MIDFHTHILPGIDDGSRNVEESLILLKKESEQDIKKILATPHFYAHKESVSHFLKCREEAYQKMAVSMSEMQLDIPVLTGAEVYYFAGMGGAEQLRSLCVQNTPLLLLELPFVQWTGEIYEDVKKMIEKQKITVLLAHVERYYEFQKDKTVWERIFELPLYAQMNTGGMERRKKRRFVEQFVKSGVPFVLGSDCHNNKERLPNMQDGISFLQKNFGQEMINRIQETEERLLMQHE